MSGRRPTGRFFILLMFTLGIVLFIVMSLLRPRAVSYALVENGTSSAARRVQAVIMRDETVATMDSGSTIKYVAREGEYVHSGDTIAYVYSAGYSANQLQQLESVRAEIRAYHLSILGTIIDTRLDVLEDSVNELALQLKTLSQNRTKGSLQALEAQLTEAMEARQTYLSQNQREDTGLTTLYENESRRQSQIASWRTAQTADRDGVVSFYLDGYETFMTPSNSGAITVDALRNILAGKSVAQAETRLQTGIYRLAPLDRWYVYILSDSGFAPLTDQHYWFQLEGFEDVVYDAAVVSSVKSGNTVMTLLQIDDPIGPLLNQRCGNGTISTDLSGLKVPQAAVVRENGQTGVYVYDGAFGTFIPVTVTGTTADGDALISTDYDQALYAGSYVLIK